MQEAFEKIIEFIYKEIDNTETFSEHHTQCSILHFVEELEEEYHNIPSDEYINRQQAIDAVGQLYRYESDRMTALQELPVVNIPKNNGWIPVEEISNRTISAERRDRMTVKEAISYAKDYEGFNEYAALFTLLIAIYDELTQKKNEEVAKAGKPHDTSNN